MEAKLIKTEIGEYEQREFDGVNRSGIQPVGERVLVLPDGMAEATRAGVFLPEEVRDRQIMAAQTGVIVDMGSDAFARHVGSGREWRDGKPEVGNYVFVAKYSGVVLRGDDGLDYRLMEDTCIGAVRKAPLAEAGHE